MSAVEALEQRTTEISALGSAAAAATATTKQATVVLASAQAQLGSAVGGIRASAFKAMQAARMVVLAAMGVIQLTDPRLLALAKLLQDIAPAVPQDPYIATIASYVMLLIADIVAGSVSVSEGLRLLRSTIIGEEGSSNLIAGAAATGARGSEAGLGFVSPEQLRAYRAIRDFAYGLSGGI